MVDESFKDMLTNILKQGLKNRRTLVISIILPLVLLMILGFMVTMAGTPDHVKIGVVNDDNGLGSVNAASSIVDELKKQENVTVVSISENEVNDDLRDKTIDAALIFPENFTVDLTKKNAQANLVLEGTDSGKAVVINKALSNSIITVAAKRGNITSPLKMDVNSLYGNDLSFTDLFMYRFMSLVTLILPMIVTILTIVGDKKTGLFNKRAKTPIKSVLAYTTGLSIFGFIIASIVLGYVTYVMDTTIVGEMSSTVLLMFLIAVMGVSLGVFATSITRTKKQAMGIFGLLLVLQIMFSGLFVPITRFNYYTQLISYSLPLTYGLDAMKSVLIRGFTLGDVVTDIIALSVITIVALVLAMIGLRVMQKKQNF